MIEADRLIDTKASREDELIDRAIRPKSLADYTGQPHVERANGNFYRSGPWSW